jgi:predicted nucleic acid-binding protein
MYLVDTNVISELRNARIANASVSSWAKGVRPEGWFLSAMTIFELERGVLKALRKDRSKGVILRSWLDERILPEFRGRVLPVDTNVALRCAALHVPDPRPERDAMIAATALVHGLTLATRNTKDFEGCGVPVFNPWLHAA